MVLIIDNYDSFVYNLAQYVGELGRQPGVYRNNRLRLTQVEDLAPTHIIISPGPGTPLEAGISNDVIGHFAGKIPILGVCLGHQCIGHAYGGRIGRSSPVHGKTSLVEHDGKTIYEGLPNPFPATRYHSLIIEDNDLPTCLDVTARTPEGTIMGVRHRDYVVEGVQFHPESVLTDVGHDILANFLRLTRPVWSELRS